MSCKNKTHINFVNLVLPKTTYLQNFVIDQWQTMSFLPVLHVTENYAHGL